MDDDVITESPAAAVDGDAWVRVLAGLDDGDDGYAGDGRDDRCPFGECREAPACVGPCTYED